MNNDNHDLANAYRRVYLTEDVDFRDQIPDSREVYDKEELGVDPEEAKVYDDAKKEISYEKYPFWDAYHAVKEGAWTEDDFVQWARSVWADGADSQEARHSEDAENKHVFTKTQHAAQKAGYSKEASAKIAGAAKAKALK